MWRWNLVILFSGNLLSQAGELLKVGLHTTDIVRGYKIGLELTLRYLDELVSFRCESFYFLFCRFGWNWKSRFECILRKTIRNWDWVNLSRFKGLSTGGFKRRYQIFSRLNSRDKSHWRTSFIINSRDSFSAQPRWERKDEKKTRKLLSINMLSKLLEPKPPERLSFVPRKIWKILLEVKKIVCTILFSFETGGSRSY